MAVLRGPFPTGGTVGPDDLVDREAIVAEMFGRTHDHLNSVVLSAPRQTGKTSVAEELLRKVRRAGGWGIYIDCSAATDERELAELIARSTYDQASGSRGAFPTGWPAIVRQGRLVTLGGSRNGSGCG
jgi:hypothetical protein